ncbi:bifunctional 3-oxoadipate enol-lactonase/4-carboxymuconolactone decarboxylase PcaDC [Actinacidiphila guanduensis]|uniref:3-oxoadipate enol-lactonase / 4-carboxymuconolactone decarboxylase n=1 Tax=Actinacidiphila guanduensis TaxID=310781 RepID=A0A1H0C0A6_9ACTN|nr:3-oxoadipate enol-lactonase [Actinacidiphila guanduensis]SDN51358.1 3-oxoadipate enol-lactonase / 4-carboxymuconolactone decarboxylase [Actinacidiphila guanduensis]
MRLHHRSDGPATGPVLLLGPSLGTSLRLWDAHVPRLAAGRRVVRWDLPGHGGSPAADTPATVAALAALVLELADELGVARFDYAGVSLGGAVGAWLAVHHPDRVGSLALLCSSARFGTPGGWQERARAVRAGGLGELADSAPGRWFSPRSGFAATAAARALVDDHRTADPEAYAACCDALAGYDLRADLHRITAPTLVLAGRDDTGTPPAYARELADGIADSALVEVPRAGHLAVAEQPSAVLAALRAHLRRDEDAPAPEAALPDRAATRADVHRAGTAVRREVLGDAWVDRAAAAATDFTAPFQDLISRYAWGEIWTRPGLDRRTRSCMTLTAMVAGGHHDELAMHVRAALTNGLTRAEIREVLLQSAVYCGVPAANTAFAIASRVLADLDNEN